jgi:ribosome-binding factor A
VRRSGSGRMRKVNELVREIVAEEVAVLKDPRIGFVTITGVNTAPDLRRAMVYYSVLGSEEEATATAAALSSASPRIQGAVGAQTRLKFTPVLTFAMDPSIETGERIERVLRQIEARSEENLA